jgi:hypothetical protein
MADKDGELRHDIQLLLNSAERLKRALNCQVFDKLNKAFIKREAKLHFKLTVRFLTRMARGRYW